MVLTPAREGEQQALQLALEASDAFEVERAALDRLLQELRFRSRVDR